MKTEQVAITILGLGPGNPELLTRQVWAYLEAADSIYLRTRHHPVVTDFPQTLKVTTFDHLYEQFDRFESVYEEIAEQVVSLGMRESGVIYAVPGDPSVGEATTALIREKAANLGLRVEVLPGISFVEPVCQALGIDPLPRLAIVDALELAGSSHPSFPPDYPALIPQLYSWSVAADVKLTLMGNYPDTHPVTLVHSAGNRAVNVESMALFEIDRSQAIDSLTCLFVPPLSGRSSMESFQDLIAELRSPEGCPWDREQTHLTLRQYTLEEAYEVVDALDREDSISLKEELGDLLIQIVLHAQIASEEGEFNMVDVIRTVSEKLVRRHPHVFGDVKLETVAAVKHQWAEIKRAERGEGNDLSSVLDGILIAQPALSLAQTYQKVVAQVGFDWPGVEGVIAKIREELEESQEAVDEVDRSKEIGDLLFSVVNLARWYGLEAEESLRETNFRFRRRFEWLEEKVQRSNRTVSKMSLQELDAIWEEAKRAVG